MKDTELAILGLTIEEYKELVGRRVTRTCPMCGRPNSVHTTEEDARKVLALCDGCLEDA